MNKHKWNRNLALVDWEIFPHDYMRLCMRLEINKIIKESIFMSLKNDGV